MCTHGRRRYHCTQCGGAGICTHRRRRARCKECDGTELCRHKRRRSQCKECKPALTTECVHGRKQRCQLCGGKPIKGAVSGGAEQQHYVAAAAAEVGDNPAAGVAMTMRADAPSYQERTVAV
ncbi:hypothetical protein JKP88DRAFT_223615 [Tribonema minus]|uniref:Uncharacterized protein n=1 Tax=Tribonema minus TaxID=303371 RepID=A0A835YRX8_9STRA|nr:hypothetical protein JKP88DRAFT_223615 [Tribonema minus]